MTTVKTDYFVEKYDNESYNKGTNRTENYFQTISLSNDDQLPASTAVPTVVMSVIKELYQVSVFRCLHSSSQK